jgi:hypothetical protein
MAMAVPATQVSAQVLIINGSSGTSEPGTTSLVTNNLVALFNAIGVNPTVVDGVPASLAGFSQVWDIRFSNNLALTGADQSEYLAFLQGGGAMFVMGENSSFTTRDASVLALISAAGGGVLSFVVPGSTENVDAPFTGPNAVSSVTYLAPGGFNGHGSGQFITDDGTGEGAGIAFGHGELTNAPLGALTTIFDVNFMQGNIDVNSQNLTKNLIGFVGDASPPGGGGAPTTTPEPASLVLVGTGLVGIGGIVRRRRRKAA